MPYRAPRKILSKKTTRRFHKRATRLSRFQIRRRYPTYTYKNKILFTNWLSVTMNGLDEYFSKSFALTECPSNADYTALYDMYKINAVKIKFIPRYNSNLVFIQSPREDGGANTDLNIDAGGTNLSSGSNWGLPELITVIDFDDDTNVSSPSELYQYANMKRTLCSREHGRYFVPRIKVDSSNTGLSMRKQWLDCDNSGVKHYGIKGCVTNVPTFPGPGSAEFRIDLEVTYYMSFKNTR